MSKIVFIHTSKIIAGTSEREKPELIEFYSENSKRKHYALLIRPFNYSNDKQYPVVQVVYGGPGVQLVRNAWSSYVICSGLNVHILKACGVGV